MHPLLPYRSATARLLEAKLVPQHAAREIIRIDPEERVLSNRIVVESVGSIRRLPSAAYHFPLRFASMKNP